MHARPQSILTNFKIFKALNNVGIVISLNLKELWRCLEYAHNYITKGTLNKSIQAIVINHDQHPITLPSVSERLTYTVFPHPLFHNTYGNMERLKHLVSCSPGRVNIFKNLYHTNLYAPFCSSPLIAVL
jgi:hypothetical protein